MARAALLGYEVIEDIGGVGLWCLRYLYYEVTCLRLMVVL